MGARILNGAVIGSQCIVGAGALVTEGKIFEPRSLIVGSPARAVRTLTDGQVAMLPISAAHYAEKAARYAANLMPVGAR
jgi:carbonic anhydrase/acetyltransferase-like protein (isoleucine patch superfamily)